MTSFCYKIQRLEYKRLEKSYLDSVILGQRYDNYQIWKTILEKLELVTSTIQKRYYKGIKFIF